MVKTKTQLIKALREIIATPDDVQEWEFDREGQSVPSHQVWVVRADRLEALLAPEPRVTLEGDRDGVTYDPERDFERLNNQMKAVWTVMRTGHWHTLAGISEITRMPEASVSARLRDLRKPKFGNQEVQTKHVSHGQWAYRVVREVVE